VGFGAGVGCGVWGVSCRVYDLGCRVALEVERERTGEREREVPNGAEGGFLGEGQLHSPNGIYSES